MKTPDLRRVLPRAGPGGAAVVRPGAAHLLGHLRGQRPAQAAAGARQPRQRPLGVLGVHGAGVLPRGSHQRSVQARHQLSRLRPQPLTITVETLRDRPIR